MLRSRLVLLALLLVLVPLPLPLFAQDPPVLVPAPSAGQAEPPAAAEAVTTPPADAAAAPVEAPVVATPPVKGKGKNTKARPASASAPAAVSIEPTPADGLPPNERYRRDLVNLLALRGDAPLLLAASVIARPDDGDEERPHGLRSATLLARAQAVGSNDALVWWLTAFSCGNAIQICPRPDAVQKLTAIAPDNVAVWVLEAQRLQTTGNGAAASAALARAGAAREYNDYSTELTRTVLQAIGDLPVPPALLQRPPPGVAATMAGVQLTLAYNLTGKYGPGAQPVAAMALQLCDPEGPAAQAAARRDACLALAAKLEWSSTLLAQRAGLALRLKLKGGKAADADTRLRNIAWQEQRSAEVMQNLLGSAAGTRDLQRLSLQSHTESGLVYAMLRAANVPLEAPLEQAGDTPEPAPAAAQN